MIRETVIKLLLAPFSLLYGGIISIRNILYKKEVLKSVKFDIPVVSIGNLSVGGTGKTPHIDYMVSWLKEYIQVGILSRGYKRESTGFVIGQQARDVKKIGDEPFQFLSKHPDVPIAVSENREIGIPLLLKSFPETRLIFLDDAFQHLSVKPHINILLTSYDALFTRDFILPSGRLREWRSSYKRADIIIVTKCPRDLTHDRSINLINEIKPMAHQQLFFTDFRYKMPYYIFNTGYKWEWNPDTYILLVSGIANTEYLEKYLEPKGKHIQKYSFADHHWYTNYDMGQIKRQFDELTGNNKIIITTEKDATRFQLHRNYLVENKLPLFILPIEVRFLFDDEEKFKNLITERLLEFKT